MTPLQGDDARLRRLTLALGLGLLLGVLLALFAGNRAASALARGDFPAFYAAAEIVWSGRGAELYDLALQRELQNRHWPDFAGEFFIFAYPPFSPCSSPLSPHCHPCWPRA